MSKLNEVISNIIIRERLVGFCEFDEVVIKRFDCLVFGWVRSDLVWMEFQRKSFVVASDLFLGGRLSQN